MNLKNTIDNTNTQKDKLKTGKRNIDNKLVELGGEEAVNLAEIPLKMQEMANQYSKIAEIKIEKNIEVGESFYGDYVENLINLNINFLPKRIFVRYVEVRSGVTSGTVDSKININSLNTSRGYLWAYIDNIKKDSFKFCAQRSPADESNSYNYKITDILVLG